MLSFLANLGIYSGLLLNKCSEHLMPFVFVGYDLLLIVEAALERGRRESVSHVISAFLYGKMVLPAALASPTTLLLLIVLIIVHSAPGHHRARPAINCAALTLAPWVDVRGGGGRRLRAELYSLPSGPGRQRGQT
jgi:hypothetical protein